MTRARGAVTLVAAALVVACGDGGGRDERAAGGDTAAPRPLVEAPAAPRADSEGAAPGAPAGDADTTCRMTGLWQRCSVEKRLERAGFGLHRLPDTVRAPGLAIAGTAYQIGRSELQIFLYADTADARREAAAVDVDDARPAATRGILRPPAVIHSQNLVALFFNNNDRQLERVQLAITAGLPAR